MLTLNEWNAIEDDEAPERQFNNYLDYENSVMPPAPNAISKQATLNPDDGQISDATSNMDEWVKANVTHPDDLEIYNAMTSGEKAFLSTLPNTPGGQERMQFIRSTPEDRAKIMASYKGADNEAFVTGGQGVKGAEPAAPLSESVYNDTQTSEEEKEKANQPTGQINTIVDWNSVNPESFNKKEIDPSARYKLKSIMDAFNDGEIDKSTRDYMIVDAIAKGLGSLGKIISNVGAQYTGGSTVDATPEQTLWDKRNEEMAKSAMESEKAGVSGSREQREYDTWAANQVAREYNNASLAQKQKMAAIVQKYAEKAPNDTVRIMYMDIASRMLSGGTINEKDLAVSGIGEIWNFLTKAVN